MAQPFIEFMAEPSCEDLTTIGVTAVSTRSSRSLWTPWSITVAQLYGEETKPKGVNDNPFMISSAVTTTCGGCRSAPLHAAVERT